MDDGLVLQVNGGEKEARMGLNPCCSGRWSRTTISVKVKSVAMLS